jgi:hypothetical protein
METRDEILRTMVGTYKKATRKEKGHSSTMSRKLQVTTGPMPRTGCVHMESGSSCGILAAVR